MRRHQRILWAGLLLLCTSLPVAAEEVIPAQILGQTSDLIRHLVMAVGANYVEEGPQSLPQELRRFYRQRAFAPVWLRREGLLPEAEALLGVLGQAEAEGLQPRHYHLREIRRRLAGPYDDALQLAQLDLLLTAAFLDYSSDVYHGRVDPNRLDPDWSMRRPALDGVDLLGRALDGHLDGLLRSLPPAQQGYLRLRHALKRYRQIVTQGGWPRIPEGELLRQGVRDKRVVALRRRLTIAGDLTAVNGDPELYDAEVRQAVSRFQRRHGLSPDGRVGEETRRALNVSAARRLALLVINLERWRWLPRDADSRFVAVNMAGFELQVIEYREPVLEMRVIIGRDYRQTPLFQSQIDSVVLNPYWYIPPGIFQQDLLPRLRRDPGLLERRGLRVFSSLNGQGEEVETAGIDWQKVGDDFPFTLRQGPGPGNPLGRVKFFLPNSHGIYLHDTPQRHLFRRTVRAFSSGCIRLERPLALAEYVLSRQAGWDRAAIDAAINEGKPRRIALDAPLPVILMYWTAWVDSDGTVNFRDDIYGRDQRLVEALARPFPRLAIGD